jgi:hypothetical protein
MSGGCLCGKVRYTANAEPMFTGMCHCRTCQKESGSAFNIVIALPASAVSFQGSLKDYTRAGDSGQQVRHRFCPDCGTTLTSEPAAMAGASIIRAGTLDDTSWLQPAMEIYCTAAQPWVHGGGERARFPGMPPRG